MVLTAMLYHLLSLRLHAGLARNKAYLGWLRIEKVSNTFSAHLMRLGFSPESWIFEPDPRHLKYEKRKRPNHWQAITQSLA